MSSRIAAVIARDEHAEAIAAFYREVWDPYATPESVLAARRTGAADNIAYPAEPPPTAIVLQGTRVIGHCGSVPQRLWNGREERSAYWVKGLMVLPEFRGGPVGFLVMKELASHLELSTILAVAPAARRLFSALGYVDLGAIPNWVRPLRPGRMLRRVDLGSIGMHVLPRWANVALHAIQRTGVAALLGGGAGSLARVGARLSRLPSANIATSLDAAAPPPDEILALWNRVRQGMAASPVRDGIYMVHRYVGGRNAERYQFVSARKRGDLVGLAVVRRPGKTADPRLSGIRVATLADLVFPLELSSAGLALLGAVEEVGRAVDADAVLCTTAHPGLVSLLKRQAYLRTAANVHFFIRDCTASANWTLCLKSWWLSRGDGHADEVF